MKVIRAKETSNPNVLLVEIEDRGWMGAPISDGSPIYKQIIDRGIEIEPADD